MLAAAGIRDQFDVVIGGNEVAQPKPAPDGLLLACERLDVSPLSVAYVGDSRLDVRCARAAGSLAVAAAWGHQFDADEPCDVRATSPVDIAQLVGSHGVSCFESPST
jgi:phosphoglycolate phosphatase/AHBA synthesis associated protein